MKHHPDTTVLAAYAEGTIDASNGLIIAAHLEVCPHCRAIVDELEEQASTQLEELIDFGHSEASLSDIDMSAMFDSITQLSKAPKVSKKPAEVCVEVNGKQFVLPKALHRLSRQMGEWKNYGGKVFSAHIDTGEQERMSLLYITDGVQVPQHTHKGVETTLVLHGSFSDETGEYKEGDFMVADGETQHAPKTMQGQDCLCLTILSDPMIFTQGVARVFNLFGRGMYP